METITIEKLNSKDFRLDLLEAVWLMRWNKEKTSMTAILTEKEADEMCNNIIKVLKNTLK